MGFSFRNLIRGKPEPEQSEPEQSVENVSRIEIADNPIESIMTEIYLRELAFQRAIQILAKMLGKCEIRTFLNGDEIFRDEYYTWNYEPNRNQNKQQFFDKLASVTGTTGEATGTVENLPNYTATELAKGTYPESPNHGSYGNNINLLWKCSGTTSGSKTGAWERIQDGTRMCMPRLSS